MDWENIDIKDWKKHIDLKYRKSTRIDKKKPRNIRIMKCKQKLCSRTKNLDKSGSCAICADAIFEAFKNYEKNKKRIPSKVDVDLKLMVETHAKLAKGLQVDPKVVSNLLLGGVINILHQHDTIAEIDGRIKQVEQGSLSDKIRIESLENWVLKQCDEIKVLNEIVSRMDKDGVVIEENKELEKVKKENNQYGSLEGLEEQNRQG